jgi:hypothetical protein
MKPDPPVTNAVGIGARDCSAIRWAPVMRDEQTNHTRFLAARDVLL